MVGRFEVLSEIRDELMRNPVFSFHKVQRALIFSSGENKDLHLLKPSVMSVVRARKYLLNKTLVRKSSRSLSLLDLGNQCSILSKFLVLINI